MDNDGYTFLKYLSIIQRNYHRYMDASLGEDGLGGGQQFFLEYIARYDGISFFDLAEVGKFDKGTVTRAVKKLEEKGLVTVRPDERDRRGKHLHVTERARPLVEKIERTRLQWKDELLGRMTPEERERLCGCLQELTEESCRILRDVTCERER